MDLLCPELVEKLRAVTELGAADNAVVAEKHPLVLQYCRVRNQLHLGHEIAGLLIDRHEGPRPGRGVLAYSPLVRNLVTLGITYCHTDSAVWNATGVIDLGVILLAHYAAGLIPHILNIASLVEAGRETVINPEEGAYLHPLVRLAEDLISVSLDSDNLARTYVMLDFVIQICK